MILGAEAIAILFNRVSQISIQTRFMIDDDTWPPKQPTSFTPLLLIHHQGDNTPEQVAAMAELMYAGDIGKVASVSDDQLAVQCPKFDGHQKLLNTSKVTKDLEKF